MIDISELESRLKKVQMKAEKAKIAFESACNEATRLETALSVIREMIGGKGAPSEGSPELTDRQRFVFNALKIGQNNALSPVEVYQAATDYAGFEGDVNYVRTTLWRLANKGQIGGAGGTYWRYEGGNAPIMTDALAALAAELPTQPAIQASWDDDLDSEIPF
jgi:hypothetical protein